MRGRTLSCLLGCFVLGLMLVADASAQIVMSTETWKDDDAEFARCDQRIRSLQGRNLLARKGVKVIADSAVGEASYLTDGNAGDRDAEGRVFIDGQPSLVTFYLGEAKGIKEIGAFTFNGDSRSNQRFEVRLANNSSKPGEMPSFPQKAQLTSGDEILGANAGGVHTRFIDQSGKLLLPGKFDWVQFSIWRTYGTHAGDRLRTAQAQGATTFVELEVLGEDHDVIVPSAAEVARLEAIRKAPKQPEYTKLANWRDTLIAGREAIIAWEGLQDTLAVPNSGCQFGPWHVLGPLARGSKEASQLEQAKTVDLAAKFAGKDGQAIGWQKREDLKDAELIDLTALAGSDKSDLVYLCRELTVERTISRNQLQLSLAMGDGWLRKLPSKDTLGLRETLAPNARVWEFEAQPGRMQLLVRLNSAGDGSRQLWFCPQANLNKPGAGDQGARNGRRQRLINQVRTDFPDAVDQAQMAAECRDDIWDTQHHHLNDWLPGQSKPFQATMYRRAIQRRLGELRTELSATAGVRAEAIAPVKERLAAWVDELPKSLSPDLSPDALRAKYEHVLGVQGAIAAAGKVRSMRLTIEEQQKLFGSRYPKAGQFLARVGELEKAVGQAWEKVLGQQAADGKPAMILAADVDKTAREILLDTPLLDFGKLLIVKGQSGFSSNWDGPNRLGSEICVLSPVRPDGQVTTIYKGNVSDMDLHWDGQRMLFADGRFIWEMNVDGSGVRRISAEDPPVTHYDACYLPDGNICCVSNACEQAVPCTGGANVGNLHLMKPDGTDEHRISFDQDHNWNPVVMNDGRVLYSRWEYVDLPHYFSRMLFRMNPDGSGQMEYYGSSSYWPNSMYWPRPIPGHPTEVVCVVSGHHGVSRVGELVILDPARGRHEADGAIQKIPGYGQKVDPVIQDQLVTNTWPRFAAPYPLAEEGTNVGAGKYFLVCVKDSEFSPWKLCLVDIFDNITPILEGGWMTPIPLRPRPMPPVLASHINRDRTDATVYLTDVYSGGGLAGYPRGSIKALRVGSHHYRFAGNGDTRASTYEGGWDVKKILGTVPVNEDGSALFHVPANTPIFLQPLDADGKAQQQMRSWYTAMPGEVASCVGCHDKQNEGPSGHPTYAATRPPVDIRPWNGPARGFSFDREVQPVLDRRCVGCHDGQSHQVADSPATAIDLRAKQLHPDFKGEYSPAYMELQRYVRRAGYESDMHMHVPAEFEPDTSQLVQMLKKGHYGVELSRDDWDRLYTWIDLNVPYPINWRESHRPPRDEQVEARVKYKKLFANIDDHDEDPVPLPPIADYQAPKQQAARPTAALTADNWPLTPEQAKELQAKTGQVEKEIDLGEGVKMKFALVPAGRFVMGDPAGFDDECRQTVATVSRPFYLGQFEVTNGQFARFDPQHDSAYVDGRFKDRTTRGYPINAPDQPVVRISWNEARAFCHWLSQRSGVRATLPTEAQWEWACRAGTATRWSFGAFEQGKTQNVANIADGSAANWNYGRAERDYNDGVQFTAPVGRYAPNTWGLHDMHGNVAEWTLSAYAPYPYNPADGRDNPSAAGPKVVRGGSWNDLMKYATSSSRWRYEPYKPVYNVGFRVLLEVPDTVAQAQ